MSHWPDKIRDDEQLYDPVDDAHWPALDHHRLCRLVGEEVGDEAPRPGAHGCSSVQVAERSGSSWIWKKNSCPASTGAVVRWGGKPDWLLTLMTEMWSQSSHWSAFLWVDCVHLLHQMFDGETSLSPSSSSLSLFHWIITQTGPPLTLL